MSKEESDAQKNAADEEDDDEPDEWEQRILNTGCAEENDKMSDCYWEKKDWRLCVAEMTAFKECWKSHNNDNRTETKDADKETTSKK